MLRRLPCLQVEAVHSLLGWVMLRRTKAEVVATLPAKTEVILPAPLSPVQRYHYSRLLQTAAGAAPQEGDNVKCRQP